KPTSSPRRRRRETTSLPCTSPSRSRTSTSCSAPCRRSKTCAACFRRLAASLPGGPRSDRPGTCSPFPPDGHPGEGHERSEEHTSELQSLTNLVCRLLLEKKKNKHKRTPPSSPPH